MYEDSSANTKSNYVVRNCSFAANTAGAAGAVGYSSYSSRVDTVGAIYLKLNSIFNEFNSTVDNCTFLRKMLLVCCRVAAGSVLVVVCLCEFMELEARTVSYMFSSTTACSQTTRLKTLGVDFY